MDSKHIKVDKKSTIWKIEQITPHLVFCMFLTMALRPVLPGLARAPHMWVLKDIEKDLS